VAERHPIVKHYQNWTDRPWPCGVPGAWHHVAGQGGHVEGEMERQPGVGVGSELEGAAEHVPQERHPALDRRGQTHQGQVAGQPRVHAVAQGLLRPRQP